MNLDGLAETKNLASSKSENVPSVMKKLRQWQASVEVSRTARNTTNVGSCIHPDGPSMHKP